MLGKQSFGGNAWMSPRAWPLLASHRGEKTHPTYSGTEPPFEPAARAYKVIPPHQDVSVIEWDRPVRRFERQDYANGTSPVSEDIRRARISHLTQDTCGIGFQLSNSDQLLDLGFALRILQVVSHVTTLFVHEFHINLHTAVCRVIARVHSDAQIIRFTVRSFRRRLTLLATAIRSGKLHRRPGTGSGFRLA